ncbi:MAG: hypothetical protein U0903_18195 [Planctomycetales bacterium]
MKISASYEFQPKIPTVKTSIVMDHFGVGFEQGEHVIARDLEIPILKGDIVCLTGESGSGKSTLLRKIQAQLQNVTPLEELELNDMPLIDGLGLEAEEGMRLLAGCGLGEAQLLLRLPAELSEGQRYRYRMAVGLSRGGAWLCADEFTATLDRTLARVLAGNLRRCARQRGMGVLVATTHEDIVEELSPDVHVCCRLDGTIEVARGEDCKKKEDCAKSWRSAPARHGTGRIFLGGITAAMPSGL